MTSLKSSPLNLTFSRSDFIERIAVIAGATLYIMLLNLIYAFHLSPYFSYLGYTLHPAPFSYLILAWVAAWLPALWMPVRLLRPSQVVYWLLYVLVYVPSTFVPFLSLERSPFHLSLLLISLVTAFATLQFIYYLPYLTLQRLKLPRLVYWGLFTGVALLFLTQIIQAFGLRFQIPNLLEVYSVRADYREVASNPLVGYSTSWLGNILCPFLIAIGFIRKSPLLIAAGIAGQLFVFSITGFKSVFFSSLLVTGLLIALSYRGRFFGLFVVWGATGLVMLTWLLDIVTQNILYSSLFVRRMIITPGILTGWYYDFFSTHPQTHLGHSILEGLVTYPYDRSPPYLIGREYFGNEQTYANANLWADAFANFGFWGIAGFTLVLGFILWLFDILLKGRSFQQLLLSALLLGVPAITLSNSALITSLTTHGVAMAWLLLFFLPKNFLRPTTQTTLVKRDEPRSHFMTARPKTKIVHLTSKHDPFDIRIFVKECRTLAANGYDVVLIAPHDKNETLEGVRLRGIPKAKTRRQRMLGTTWDVYRAAVTEDARLYHFHDPELIPIGLLLKLRGKKVIYDVHEDLPRQILSKHWVKPYIRRPLAWVMELVEGVSARIFDGIITVTTTIAKRFPKNKTALVQNFPILNELVSTNPIPYEERPPIIAYVGGITAIRGIKEMIEAMALLPESLNAKLVLAGTFEPPSLENEMRKLPGWERVEARGWQSRQEVATLLSNSRLGLIVYHPEPNHVNAQPNKLFEYMSAGLPVIASDFPLWEEIIEGAKSGLLVDPLNPQSIANKIYYLLENSQEAEHMGKRGFEAIFSRFNWAQEEKTLLTVYERVS
jgi:glycosyltransferase involved in cell wall biosynthesis